MLESLPSDLQVYQLRGSNAWTDRAAFHNYNETCRDIDQGIKLQLSIFVTMYSRKISNWLLPTSDWTLPFCDILWTLMTYLSYTG